MKRVMTTALVLALLGGTSALAAGQDRDDRGGGRVERGGGRPEGPRGDGPRGDGPRGERPQFQQRQERPAPQPQAPAPQPAAPQAAAPQAVGPRAPQPRREFNGPLGGVQQQVQAQQAQPQPQPQAPSRPSITGQGFRGDRNGDGRPDFGGRVDRNGDGRPDLGGRGDRNNDGRPDFNGRVDRNNDGRPDYNGRFDRNNDGRPDGGRFNGRPGNDGRFDGRPGFNDGRGDYRWDRRSAPQSRPPIVRPQDRWDRDRNRPRYDRNRWVFLIQPRQHYNWRGPAYYAPYDFYPRSFAYGQTLPWSWYTPDYYIDNWSWYGLPIPPVGCEWVRLGNDAVLVDVFSGRVLSVVYSLFW